jgi:hypothetical protein
MRSGRCRKCRRTQFRTSTLSSFCFSGHKTHDFGCADPVGPRVRIGHELQAGDGEYAESRKKGARALRSSCRCQTLTRRTPRR